MIRRLLLGGAALALSACAVTRLPELPPTHPASPNAAAAPARPRDPLKMDDATRTTDQLLSSGPSPSTSDSNSDSMSAMPGMNH